ncbi:hypothetical protein E2C01_069259 [Portunus trituberculatus]|uniref:Uncharacterized protein n=1 Tax=Portunus trituberculatus TaxID=210409 RepID=A0A5B7HQZ3_PORTR|nr:hypothetical protein [Portunus trituberculatus]
MLWLGECAGLRRGRGTASWPVISSMYHAGRVARGSMNSAWTQQERNTKAAMRRGVFASYKSEGSLR